MNKSKGWTKKNAINISISVFMANHYIIHIFGSNTFSMSAFDDDGWISISNMLVLLFAQIIVIWHIFKASTFKRKRSSHH